MDFLKLDDDFFKTSSTSYPLNSCNQASSGRFHKVGQATYYHFSPVSPPKAEGYGSHSSGLNPTHSGRQEPNNIYELFNCNRFLEEHPDLNSLYFPTDSESGWVHCQELRNYLEILGCSGVIYPGQEQEGGYNVAIGPLDVKPLAEEYFKPLPSKA
jgi:hypothetical protein